MSRLVTARDGWAQRVKAYQGASHERLVNELLNNDYNGFCADNCDYDENTDLNDKHGHGKRIPYLGWFWRRLDFASGVLPLGRSDYGERMVGLMANNKWNYDGRPTTGDEFARIVGLIDEARPLMGDDFEAKLAELWDYVQSLGDTGDWR